MRRGPAVMCVLVFAGGVAGCGGSDDDPVAPPPKQRPIGAEQLDSTRAGSPEHTLLEYWSALQFSAWAQAVGYLDPGLREFIGTSRIVRALEVKSAEFEISAPDIRRVIRRGREATVHYALALPDAKKLESITFERSGRDWRILVDSQLDDALRLRAEQDVDGTDRQQPTASAKAKAAGERAAALPARFLDHRPVPAD